MDVKSAFLYETIEKEVYVCQPPRFEDPDYPDKVYKVVKALYRLHQAPRACQDKYVAEILRKFGLTDGKSASTPIDTEKPLLKDPDVKRIFRYLKGKPYLGLWYPKYSPFTLVAYSDSDYAGASQDKKSTTKGCQFLRCRLISWKCKKKTVVATSSTEFEYVASASCYAQVLWTHNQLLDYGKKVIITEATIQEAFQLDDAESIDCLPNEEIFAELSRMRTSWNEFSSSMASAVICLSTGRKFNFSKAQVGDLSSHSTKYSSPALTKKMSANMRRVRKGFSGVDTPLFEGMIVAQQDDDVVDEDADEDVTLKDVAAVEKDAEIEENADDDEIDPTKLKEVVEVVTTAKLMTEVVTAASATITAATTPIHAFTITNAPSAARRRKGVATPLARKVPVVDYEIYTENNKPYESQAEKAAKKQKLDEEVAELKKHLHIVPNDEDDVYTEATPLARKVPVVDYEIYTENNKP
nr:hypothetical protein [Tanacetum cinerariifolium]